MNDKVWDYRFTVTLRSPHEPTEIGEALRTRAKQFVRSMDLNAGRNVSAWCNEKVLVEIPWQMPKVGENWRSHNQRPYRRVIWVSNAQTCAMVEQDDLGIPPLYLTFTQMKDHWERVDG